MKKALILSLFLLVSTSFLIAGPDRNLLQQKCSSISDLRSKLILDKSWVQYPQYSDRGAWNALLGNNKQYLIEEGEKYLTYEWRVIRAIDYLAYKRTGERMTMQNHYQSNAIAINSLFLAELAEGKGRFTDQLINGVFHTCEMTSWVLSAHLVVQKTGSSLPNHNEHIIDLVSAEVGAQMSWIYYFFHKEFDQIEPYISQRLKKEIEDKAIKPYLERDNFRWMALTESATPVRVNNWNPWCNSNTLMCILLIEDDAEKMLEGVYKSIRSADKFINYVKADGACEEGPAYWEHAAGKLYDYLQVLHDATAGRISLFDEPMIKRMGEYISRTYIGDNWVVNFADATARMSFTPHHIYRYGKAVDSQEMMQFAAYLQKQEPGKMHIDRDTYRLLEQIASGDAMDKIAPIHSNPMYTWYPETEFCYIKLDHLVFAAKGGFNNESHNHNDVGTFSLFLNNTPIFIDAGVGTYTKKTFSNERYDIWTMQSDYHNLPKINGFSQSFGAEYKAVNTNLNQKKNTFSLDIANAYPKEAGIKSWTREYKIDGKGLKIEDQFDITNPTKANTINFLVWGAIDLSTEGTIGINTKGQAVTLEYDSKLFKASVETIEQNDSRLSNVWGKEIYRISLDALTITNSGKHTFTIKYKI